MSNLFSRLESMGFKGLENVEIFENEKKENPEVKTTEKTEPQISEADFLFDKNYRCPICDKEFKSKTVKTGKARLIGSDSDLRPKYSGIDTIKYDAIVCPNCGYGALSRYYTVITSAQAKLVRDNISAAFTGLPEYGDIYTYEEAIARFSLTLLGAIVKKAKNSERAYICLKIAWLYKGMMESLSKDSKDYESIVKDCKKNENEMRSYALEGFLLSRSKEGFPICGMDEYTFDYLIADLATKTEKYDIAVQFTSNVILSKTANNKIKEKARDLRELIKSKLKSE